MLKPFRSVLTLVALAAGLSGCGTVNEKLSAGMGDYVRNGPAACRPTHRRGPARPNTTPT